MTATMPATTTATGADPELLPAPTNGRWLDDWRPEDRAFWDNGGAAVARRNLFFSVLSEHVGFAVWSLWSVFVLFLTPKYGISTTPSTAAAEKFMLTTLPTGVGAFVRLPYTFAVAKFGGRNWTIISALLLLVPTVALAIELKPGVSYHELLVLAALTGIGGGNFASSMTNINSFFPQRLKGRALGLNAGGGNLGVAVVLLLGLLVLATAGKSHPRYMLGVYIPLVVLAALGAALFMNNISNVRNEKGAMREAAKEAHTWVIAVLYIGTFGSFIGFGFAFGQVLVNQFPTHFFTNGKVDPVKVAYLTFLGPLVGSLIRPVGGLLADRIGGAKTSLVNFVLMAVSAGVVLVASTQKSLPLFFVGFVALFVFSGIGNGSVYKMIPAIFKAKNADEHVARRKANAVIGIAGAIGAGGGVLVNIAFRQSFLHTGVKNAKGVFTTPPDGNPAYIAFIAFYVVCALLTFAVYLRPSPTKLAGV